MGNRNWSEERGRFQTSRTEKLAIPSKRRNISTPSPLYKGGRGSKKEKRSRRRGRGRRGSLINGRRVARSNTQKKK